MTSDTQVSRTRKLVVTALGIVTLLCATLYFLSFVLVIWQMLACVYDGPIGSIVIVTFTLPTAIICTVISLILVGPRGCKLAWISLCVFPLSIIILIAMVLFAPDTKLR